MSSSLVPTGPNTNKPPAVLIVYQCRTSAVSRADGWGDGKEWEGWKYQNALTALAASRLA
ncbi:hypothetical protein NEUTE1DRAFT_148565 [Neurospora tetrasperma FGSC 2508]|uniref:Uncharacterized protein n=1 Tax=Neurospora tetrasperma (strain FGSC 2508 / ATCC MYA-4615 / P0657) TaxID=510951 RepID=F8MWM6_NEUT8|nr:uncharacterized protein NEUTE1DRAFT_148565 [Neurospora tetrasperma FGSC 2508]EGO54147.1 hypothetical protein NEUTE1DRAFT_148565 [Neurospora tetrasperma FGSC 2508]